MTQPGALPMGDVVGATVPRLHTPPLVAGPPGPCGCGCALTPETSEGYDVIDFATDVLGLPPDPWQRWLLIHALELLPDGRPRFRRVLVLVARQNGKTYLMAILACYWMYVCGPLMVLGSSTKTSTAVKAWRAAITMAKSNPELAAEIPGKNGILTASGKEQWNLTNGSRYEPVASNEEGGRGDALDRVVNDELRQHFDYSAYGASYHAMRARPYGQWWGISSMGSARSVVLNDLRDIAIAYIESGIGDERLGLMEWSPERTADPLDPHALAQANPNVGRRFPISDLISEAQGAIRKGGEMLTDFKTEAMNIYVAVLNAAIDPAAWELCKVAGSIGDLRGSLAACVDVAPSGQHASLVLAAPMPDGRIRVEVARSWDGATASTDMETELPALLGRIKPRVLGWFPNGPAAEIAATLKERKGRTSWPPRGVAVEELRAENAAVCMGFAAQVRALDVVHSGEPLLDAHALGAERLPRGDGWVFSRKGAGDCDAVYGAAGAAHLARTLPTSKGRIRVVKPATRESGD